MKKLLVIAGAIALIGTAAVAPVAVSASNVSIVKAAWKNAKKGMWPGKDMVWYKLDKKAMLWWSKDGKKWETAKDGMWQDNEGKWLKIGGGKLWWSADGGKTWGEVPEWKWEASDGKWYKFDKKWKVWVNA